MRSMGRFDRLASPVMVALTPGFPARRPQSVLAVVPEFPASRADEGEARPEGAETERVVPFLRISAPVFSRQERVDAQSAPSEKLCTVTPSTETAPSSAALWDMDLSPGRVTVPVIFFAGWILFIACTPLFVWCENKKDRISAGNRIRSLLFFLFPPRGAVVVPVLLTPYPPKL